jgi:ppGpp synthetase/RelA/SpoT-type nucleotidyltranferase
MSKGKLRTISRINSEKKLQSEIEDFLRDHGDRYINTLKEVKELFLKYHRSSRGRWILYRIESRADSQGGKELKEISSIVEKIQRKRSKKRTYSVFEMEDIIGLRLICPYVSDLKEVVRYILQDQDKLKILEIEFHGLKDLYDEFDRLRDFEKLRREEFSKDDRLMALGENLYPEPRYIRRADGYRGIHITVSVHKPVELKDVKCEVQVSTAILRALADKTHDLIYKEREVEKPYRNIVSNISDGLFADDQQTEIAKQEIVRRRTEETLRRRGVYIQHCRIAIERIERREASILEEIQALCYKVKDYMEAKANFEQVRCPVEDRINSYLNGLISYRDLIEGRFSCVVTEETGKPLETRELGVKDIKDYVIKAKKLALDLDELIDGIIEVKESAKDFLEHRILCQMLSGLAMCDEFDRFDHIALSWLRRLTGTASSPREILDACSTEALFLYGLSRFKEAYKVLRSAISQVEEHLEPSLLVHPKNSCAYYAVERRDELLRLEEPYPDEEAEAEELEEESQRFAGENVDILEKDETLDMLKKEEIDVDWLKILCKDTQIFVNLVCCSSVDDIAKLLAASRQLRDEVLNSTEFSDRDKAFVKQYYMKNILKAGERLAGTPRG